MPKKPVIAIFDFDGTLTNGDTFLPFLFYCFGKWKVILGLFFTFPYTVGYLLNIISNQKAKKMVINYFFKTQSIRFINKCANNYINEKVDDYLRTNIVNRLKWHQNNGHVTVLLSASLEVYINLWAKKYNFNYSEGTQLENDDGKYTGNIYGDNCYGYEKVKRINKIFEGHLKDYIIYGYGDSKGDQHYLDLCDHKYSKKEFQYI